MAMVAGKTVVWKGWSEADLATTPPVAAFLVAAMASRLGKLVEHWVVEASAVARMVATAETAAAGTALGW